MKYHKILLDCGSTVYYLNGTVVASAQGREMYNERVKQVKIRKGSSWFYSKHTINGEQREINTRVRIRGQRPEKFNLRGDAEFEESKIEAMTVASKKQEELEKSRTQEELANLIYEAQTGGQYLPTFDISDLYETWLNKPRDTNSVSDKRKQFCKTVITRFTKFIDLNYPTAKTVHQTTPTMAIRRTLRNKTHSFHA